ncbi:hypothetical protein AAG570_008975 [Ranatra chinensis]|uniref:Uncharacterized protein n=1 Tax=Ranatra chinensis TaxID=642074 RepID=A0ABD0Z9I1_9HEMI
MASKRRNMFQKNKTEETTENGGSATPASEVQTAGRRRTDLINHSNRTDHTSRQGSTGPLRPPDIVSMVRAASPQHAVPLLGALLGAMCLAWPHSVMAIDLTRLYGHLSAKRNRTIGD